MSPRLRVVLIVPAALLAAGFTFPWTGEDAKTNAIAGMARQTEIRIAPEVDGRLRQAAVAPGRHIEKGALLATLDNPDLVAAVGQAEAQLANARAERDNVYSGVRAEQIAINAEAVKTAETNFTLAQQQNVRVSTLAVRGFNSRAQLDESNAELAKAKADVDLKRAQLAAARAGPTVEEREVADAKAALAEASLATVRAKLEKTRLTAPEPGAVGMQVAEIDEVVTPGKPVMTFVPDRGLWFEFTIREDALHGLSVGSQVTLHGVDNATFDARLTELRPLGEFATWRAARAVGDHDLNSFRARFDPTGDVKGLMPGMTVFLTPP